MDTAGVITDFSTVWGYWLGQDFIAVPKLPLIRGNFKPPCEVRLPGGNYKTVVEEQHDSLIFSPITGTYRKREIVCEQPVSTPDGEEVAS